MGEAGRELREEWNSHYGVPLWGEPDQQYTLLSITFPAMQLKFRQCKT